MVFKGYLQPVQNLRQVKIQLLKFFGQKIIDGVAQYIPAMRQARLRQVMAGIVKSRGSVGIRDRDSPFHKRDYDGVEEQMTGWIDNAAMKLSYSLYQKTNLLSCFSLSNSTSPFGLKLAKKPQLYENTTSFFHQFYLQNPLLNRPIDLFFGIGNAKKVGEIILGYEKRKNLDENPASVHQT